MSLRAPHGLLAAGTLALQVFATSPADAFDEGNRQYGLGNYPEAIRHYESVVAQHGVSAPLLYNLGTAQLRAAKLGAASASLIAAQRLAPNDVNVARNLFETRRRSRDAAPLASGPAAALSFFTPNTWAMLAMLGWWATCVLGAAMILRAPVRARLRLPLATAAGTTILLAIVSFVTSSERTGEPLAFVSGDGAGVRRAPLSEGEIEFTLGDGTAVRTMDALANWRLIRAGDGREGWISTGDLAIPLVP